MKKNALIICLLLIFGMAGVCVADQHENYPERTIEIIVPYAPGGGADNVARKFAELSDFDFRITNISGAGGAKGAMEGFLAKPDGYTIVTQIGRYYAFTDKMEIIKQPGFSWDEMEYIGAPVEDEVVFTVLEDSSIDDWDSMIEKAREDKVKIAGIGAHGTARFVTDQIEKAYDDVNFSYVAEDSGMDTRTALLGEHVDVRWSQMSENKDLIEAGDVKAIATWGSERSEFTPDVPTIKELDIETLAQKDLVVDVMARGFFAPPETPDEIVEILGKEVERVSKMPEFQEYVKDQGYKATHYDSEEMFEHAEAWFDRYSVVKKYFEEQKESN